MVNDVNPTMLIQGVFAVGHYLVANLEPFSYLHTALQVCNPQRNGYKVKGAIGDLPYAQVAVNVVDGGIGGNRRCPKSRQGDRDFDQFAHRRQRIRNLIEDNLGKGFLRYRVCQGFDPQYTSGLLFPCLGT